MYRIFPNETLPFFLSRITQFGNQLGPLLFQFPPWFGSKDRLIEFITYLLSQPPSALPSAIAIELRHENLLTPEAFDLLRENGIALCCNDDRLPLEKWPQPGKIAYLRLRNAPFTREQLDRVAEVILNWADRGVECYIYFKHEDEPPAGALEMVEFIKSSVLHPAH